MVLCVNSGLLACNKPGMLYNLGVFGVWRSLAARFVRVEEVAGSSPATPTADTSQVLISCEVFLFGVVVPECYPLR